MYKKAVSRQTKIVVAAIVVGGGAGELHAANITRANNSNALNTGAAWLGGNVPTAADLAVWNSSSLGGGQTLGGNASLAGILITGATPTSGPLFTNALNGSAVSIGLGASGIDLNTGGTTNRGITFESNVGVVLNANQTWAMGIGQGSANIVASGVISGTGSLSITRSSTALNQLTLSGANTFNGGLTLGTNHRVLVGGSGSSTTTASAVSTSQLGIGTVTVNSGTIATSGGGNIDLAFTSMNLAGDLTIGEATTNTGRLRIAGAIDLGNATRVITITNSGTGSSAKFGFVPFNTTYVSSVSNGTLSIQTTSANITAGNKATIVFAAQNAVGFTNNAGLILGNGVTTNFGSGLAFASNAADKIPNLTIEAGGILDLSDNAANSRTVAIASLSGAGSVINGANTNGAASLTINQNNSGALSGTDFSGQINDGATGRVVSLIKSGSGKTQILSGTNAYSGTTTINSGTLQIGNGGATGRLTATSAISFGGTSGNLTINRNNAFSQATDLGAGVPIIGDGSFTQAGSGNTTLTATNLYTGPTTISAGTLTLASTGSIASSSVIDVRSGAAFDVSAVSGFAVVATQTLKGNGTVVGGPTINGLLSPGASAGSLTINGSLALGASASTYMEIDGTGSVRGAHPSNGYDWVNVTGSPGTISYDGTLKVDFLDAVPTSGSFDLFDFAGTPGVGGSFAVKVYNNGPTEILSLTSGGGGVYSGVISGILFSFNTGDGVLSLSAAAIPEPLTAASVVLLAGRVLGRRTRTEL